jgi:putative ABC transport system substrate-binding protein
MRLRICLLTMLLVLLALLPPEVRAEKKIGILMYSEEARYYDSLRGIREQLAKAGYREPAVKFMIGNAGGNKARAAELVQELDRGNLSLMITLGTNATIAAAREIHNVPLVFSMVFDPIEARVAKDWKHPGTNATGVSPRVPMGELVNRLKELKPVRRIGALYTPGEKNSESQLRELQNLQASFGIKVIPVIISRKEDLGQILPDVLPTMDALYISGSSIIGSALPTVVELATRARIITITHLEDLVQQGIMLGVCSDPYTLGVMAGKKAVAVLRGAKPSTIPIEFMTKPGLYINRKTALATGINLPKKFQQKAVHIFE